MAAVLEAAASSSVAAPADPQQVLDGLNNFKGWSGDKAVICWRGLAFWHAASCELSLCSFEAGLEANISSCPVMRAAIHLATHGLEPGRWYKETVTHDKEPKSGWSPSCIPLTASEEAFASAQHDRFEAAGVLTRISKRTSAQWQKQSLRPSFGFVVRKWKALQSPQASLALRRWLASSPDQVAAFAGGDPAVVPPAAAYKGKDRVVYDFKQVNAATLSLPMTFHTIQEVFNHICEDDWLLVLDIEDGFTGIPVAPAASTLFWVRTQGQPDVTLQRMPFGYALAPFVFCLVSAVLGEVIAVALAGYRAEVFVYMDDVLVRFKAESEESALAARDMAVRVFNDFGFNVNPSKVDGPARQVKYLGYALAVSADACHLTMPSEKLLTYYQLMRMLGELVAAQVASGLTPTLPKRAIESLIGKMEHVGSLLPLAKHRLAQLYALTRLPAWRYTKRLGRVHLTTGSLSALNWFMNQLTTSPALKRKFQTNPDPGPWTFFGASDASGEGGIGGYLTASESPLREERGRASHWSFRLPGTTTSTELVGQSTALELKGIIVAVEAARARVGPRNTYPLFKLTLAVDSQAAHYISRKGYSTANPNLNLLAGRLKELQVRSGCNLTIIWIQGRFNWLADALSHPEADHSELTLLKPPRNINELRTSEPLTTETPIEQLMSPTADTRQQRPLQHSLPTASPRPRYHPRKPTQGGIWTLSIISLFLFAAAHACASELDEMSSPGDLKLEAKNRIDALATSTSLGYLQSASRFVSSIPISHPISYSAVSMFAENKVTSGTWASHNVASYITDITSALSWLALPLPTDFQGKRKDWLLRALKKARASRGPRKRKYFSIERLVRITETIKRKHAQRRSHGAIAIAALWMGFLGTMRTNELRLLRRKHIKTLPRQGTPDRFRIRISDKTHPHNNRRIIIPILESWRQESDRLVLRLNHRKRNARVLRKKEWATLVEGLSAHNRKPGNLRPAGNTFWIESDTRDAVIVANGGWSAKSLVPGKHYTTVTGSIASKLKASAEARIERSGVENAGGTPRPRR